jgi:site-specific recombinase XerD
MLVRDTYSLKDSGITDMLAAGVSPAFVQGQADHSDLSITAVYAHTRTKAYNELRNLDTKK